ncbi:MAG: aspartyl protease family protein [Gammaproteobacteria bacterium]|jgi:aspartyl protease family protein
MGDARLLMMDSKTLPTPNSHAKVGMPCARARQHRVCSTALAMTWLVALVCAFTIAPAHAVETIEVQALFKGRAVMLLDGKRRLLKAGETSPEGVRLIRSSSKGAELEINGKRRTVQLGRRISSQFAAPRAQKVRVIADAQGMYRSNGSINGVPMRFLLDTGATRVSINEAHAKKIGIDYERLGTRGSSVTASGVAAIWLIKLSRVTLGEIELRDVDAAVHSGEFPPIALLGNSFLSRLSMLRSGGAVVLQRNY